MWLAVLVMITALTISSVAIYYSVAGLVAIFASAAIPIIIMGSALEVGKLVAAVWLHKYWDRAAWWLRAYLSVSVLVLMFITSMGIFGFLSKAHIEQTSNAQEGVAQIERAATEIARQNEIIVRAEDKIRKAESSSSNFNTEVQTQIDQEQERIDSTYNRIQPAITEQNAIIENARTDDAERTKPYEEQLINIQAEVIRLEATAGEYEQSITTLGADNSSVQPLLDSITNIEAEIIRVTNQLQSNEREQIRAGQAIIGVRSDGAFGSDTRRALVAWADAQRGRITQLQLDVSSIRQDSTTQVDTERTRLAGVIYEIRTTQIPSLKDREVAMLTKIDEVRSGESPSIATARDEIARIRNGAEQQIAASQALIERLRNSLQVGADENSDTIVQAQTIKIREANETIDALTEQQYTLQAEYRKLEAEVGPVKYLAEFIYGKDAGQDLLEEAVRWVIIVIIFVFDPLAVVLLLASQYTFEWNRKHKKTDDVEPDPTPSGNPIPKIEDTISINTPETWHSVSSTSPIDWTLSPVLTPVSANIVSYNISETSIEQPSIEESILPELEEIIQNMSPEVEIEKEQRSETIQPLPDTKPGAKSISKIFRFAEKNKD
tara:strand:+ start:6928 stop:8748 length:1821 start_codon:yes stop_codon:yes gene_type:complete